MKKFLSLLALAVLTIGLLGSCKKSTPVSGVSLDKATLELTEGDTEVLTPTIFPVEADNKNVSWSSDKTDVATVDQEGNVHALAEGTATITVTTTDGGKTATCAVTVKAAIPEGALSGGFSVSATKKVHFSKGNLVATIDASGAPTAWKFAANQYDYLENGGAKLTIGNAAGDVDLFVWSTPGTTYGISNSENDSDYSGDFVDWGKAIGDGNTWHTPSKEEWTYLTNNDGADNVRKGKYKYGVTVCEKTNCLILAPDDFTGEIATSYDAAAWASAEAAGLVCLPAAGYSDGAEIRGVGTSGYYWSSSTKNKDITSYYMQFRSGSGRSDGEVYRDNGFSVRLITDVK